MNKQDILKYYKNEEDKLLVAKVLDKFTIANTKNKITNTDFLDLRQINLIEKLLKQIRCQNYICFGGYENAERKLVIFFSDKFESNIIEKNYNQIMSIIQITLPNELKNKYTHRDYLSGLMKIGIKREKIGDIIVYENGADIIILNEISKYVLTNIQELTRFSKSNIEINKLENIHSVEIKKEEINITVASLRLDNIVSELAKTSRTKSEEIILSGRVFLNFENEYKSAKLIKQGDIITIRGKGRFEIDSVIGNTKKGKVILKVLHLI